MTTAYGGRGNPKTGAAYTTVVVLLRTCGMAGECDGDEVAAETRLVAVGGGAFATKPVPGLPCAFRTRSSSSLRSRSSFQALSITEHKQRHAGANKKRCTHYTGKPLPAAHTGKPLPAAAQGRASGLRLRSD